MILGTTNSPSLVAGITEINAASAREEAYKTRIAELEGALAETQGRLSFYIRMWERQVDAYDAMHKEYVKACKDIVHMQASEYRREQREQAETAIRDLSEYRQPRRAGGWV
ncbi:MAG: hypothetical protein ACLTAO_00225 [Christensenellales bacterium]